MTDEEKSAEMTGISDYKTMPLLLPLGAVACVTLLDRLQGDQIDLPHETLKEFGDRPAVLVTRLIKKRLGMEE